MRKIICCMVMFITVFLTACSTSTSGNGGNSDNNSNPNESNPIAAAQEREWVYVPERIEIQDKMADYDAMQLTGGTVCYLGVNGGTEGETQSICRYSLVDRELKVSPLTGRMMGVFVRSAAILLMKTVIHG